jgi:parvulin-like peptidyl-prolyl isomerase
MGLTNLRTKFRDSNKHAWWGVLLILGLMMLLPLFFSGFTGRNNRLPPEEQKRKAAIDASQQAVAKVGPEAISRGQLDEYIDAASSGRSLQPIQRHLYAPTVLGELEDQTVMLLAARKQNIKVSSSDVDAEIDKEVSDQAHKNGVYDLVEEQRQPLLDQIRSGVEAQRDEIQSGLVRKRLQDKLQKTVTLNTPGIGEGDIEINARHILIQYKGARGAAKTITRTKEQAKALATRLTADAQKNPSSFAVLAQKNSDEPGAKSSSGDLGWFDKTRLVPEFWKAAYAAKPGTIVGPAETQFGFHVIKVEDRRVSQARQAKEIQKVVDAEKKANKIEILAPDVKAAQAYEDFRKEPSKDKKVTDAKRATVITAYQAAATARPDDPSLPMMLGMLYKEANDTANAVAAFQKAAKLGSDPEVHLNLADLYRKQGKKPEAISEYELAGRLGSDNTMVHSIMLSAYKQMGEKKLAKAQQEWLANATKGQGAENAPVRAGG